MSQDLCATAWRCGHEDPCDLDSGLIQFVVQAKNEHFAFIFNCFSHGCLRYEGPPRRAVSTGCTTNSTKSESGTAQTNKNRKMQIIRAVFADETQARTSPHTTAPKRRGAHIRKSQTTVRPPFPFCAIVPAMVVVSRNSFCYLSLY